MKRLIEICRTLAYRVAWLFSRTTTEVGSGLMIRGRLRIRGPGRVIFGDDVVIEGRTDLYTHSSDAIIQIGDGTTLNGTRIGCCKKVTVGKRCQIAETRMMDTDFHSVAKNRQQKSARVVVREIMIADEVVIEANSAILRGVSVGSGSRILAGSIVTRTIEAGVTVSGNPAQPQQYKARSIVPE